MSIAQPDRTPTSLGAVWTSAGGRVKPPGTAHALARAIRETPGARSLLLFAFAMATHFIVNDHGLRQDHRERYDHAGRWLLGAAVLSGWAVGALAPVPPAAIAALFAFLAGGVILNVMKEELPEERESRFSAFAAGAAGYAVLLLMI